MSYTSSDKNDNNLHWPLIDLFNTYIAAWALREIPRTGARFTWSNRQLNPVRSALDRVFASPSFEALFPLCSMEAVTSLGSDHTPVLFDRETVRMCAVLCSFSKPSGLHDMCFCH